MIYEELFGAIITTARREESQRARKGDRPKARLTFDAHLYAGFDLIVSAQLATDTRVLPDPRI